MGGSRRSPFRNAAGSLRAMLLVILLLMTSLWPVLARAEVVRIEITKRTAVAEGAFFGKSGVYEKIAGRFYGELDPAHPMNVGIVDLDLAPRNAKGRIEYSADFLLLKPVDLTKGNGTLLYDVNNRGNLRALQQFNSAPNNNDPMAAADMGNGFLMRNGFTVVWSGWLPDLEEGRGLLRLIVPVARGPKGPIEQMVWDEIAFNGKPVTEAKLSFHAATTDPASATLYIRETRSAPARLVPASQWQFVNDRTIRLLPAGTPFQHALLYQFVYRAVDPPVAGIGFAATRDWIAFLRHGIADAAGTPNPLASGSAPAIQRAVAHGTSQSGRYLRNFVYSGFNEDEHGRIVFDGMNPHIATARLFLNFRFAQPDRGAHSNGYGSQFYPDVSFPFAYENQTDPVTGRTDGLLARCTERGNCPKILHTISANEYWYSSQSLGTTDPLGQRDTTPPENVRVYFVAGTEHLGGRGWVNAPGFCQEPYNPVDLTPVLRASLMHLDRWVKDGTLPPLSRYPRLADGTLVPGDQVGFPKVTGVTWPERSMARPVLDYGPDFRRGLIAKVLPDATAKAYPTLVPKVDRDGNETSGIRLPDVAVPVATVTGWALRSKDLPAAGELCALDGSRIPFAKTRAEREARGDTRLSLQERYRDVADYAERIRQAAQALAAEGYLLPEDVERIAEKARAMAW